MSLADQCRRALPVLVEARQRVIGGEEPLAAIADIGRAGIVCEYARRALRAVLFHENLLTWQASRATSRSDLRRAFDKAIRLCRRTDVRRGGWSVARVAA